MTRTEVFYANIKLQSLCDEVIRACHVQNYDRAIRQFYNVIQTVSPVLESVFSDMEFYNQDMELVNPEAVSAALQSIVDTQESRDYILMADLLQLQLVPFIQSLQNHLQSHEDVAAKQDIWETNIGILKTKDKLLAGTLEQFHQKQQTGAVDKGLLHHLEMTNSGSLTLAGEDEKGIYYYHSNVSPESEARDFADYYYQTGQDEYVLWGLGLGYHVKALFDIDDGIWLQVFENDIEVIYYCMQAVDMSGLFDSDNFRLIYDPEFTKVSDALLNAKGFIIHSPSLRHIPNRELREKMEMYFIRESGKRNAAILFENNIRENRKNCDDVVDVLENEFCGRHVVIVAAGPSLDQNVELLKDKGERVIILAVETVFRKLVNMGVAVDYVIVSDANSRIYAHLRGLEQQKVPMLILSTAYKGYSMNYEGKKYLICQSGYEAAEELAGENRWKLYETGGSVSTTALDVCIRLGCASVAFIGLDLAYTNNLAHAADTSRRAAGDTTDMLRVPAVGGGMVPSSRLFCIYKKWIENRILEADAVMPIYDATEGGAAIKGLQLITLANYLATRE